jgi:hypothetical protein
MTAAQTTDPVTRRAALAGLGATGLGLALAATTHHTTAQDATAEMAKHPLVGTWLAGRTPDGLTVTHWGPDGNMTTNLGANSNGGFIVPGPGGTLTYTNHAMGTWEPVSERGIHFTFTDAVFDATGASVGTGTVDGYPVASEDGQSFWDDGTQVTVTLRDATGAVTQVLGPGLEGSGIGGVRMAPGKPGYDEMLAMIAAQQKATPEVGTPTP